MTTPRLHHTQWTKWIPNRSDSRQCHLVGVASLCARASPMWRQGREAAERGESDSLRRQFAAPDATLRDAKARFDFLRTRNPESLADGSTRRAAVDELSEGGGSCHSSPTPSYDTV